MLRPTTLLLLTAAFLCLLAPPASAQPLSTAFTFQGKLDTAGSPVSGPYDFKFTLYDAATGGTQLGPQLCSDNLPLLNGLVMVQLDFGSQFVGQQRFLEVWTRPHNGLGCAANTGFITLSPRQSLTAAPNAIFSLSAAAATSAGTATNATQLNSQPASFYTNAANLSSGTLPNARTTGIATNAANTLVLRDASGNFSAGTISASFSGSGAAITALNASNLSTGSLADARLSSNVDLLSSAQTITGAKTFAANTVFNSPVGIGTATPDNTLHVMKAPAGTVGGNANAPLVVENNTNCYLQLLAPNASESGVLFGRPTDNAHGGIIYSSGINGNGMEFRTAGNVARAYIDASGNLSIGAPPPNSNKLWVNGTTLLGGPLTVQGMGTFLGGIDAASKAFKIDHPLDPKNKLLYHSCVESPDMMNLYNGNITTDAHGYATITLPDYFEALNKDFRYQLTVLDESDQDEAFIWAKVVRKVHDHQFTIRTSRPAVEVSWQVSGIRHDAFADKHRIEVEVEKSPDQKGKYLYPEALDLPTDRPAAPPNPQTRATTRRPDAS